jgi:hypothetical protein
MMYPQRSRPQVESHTLRDELWLARSDAPPYPEAADYYVVVDERIESTIRLSVASWPRLDQAGRLSFERHYAPVFVDEGRLLAVVNAHRRQTGQLERVLRVGDTFLVRSDSARGPGRRPEAWRNVFDVTAPAREESKIALYSAVAPLDEGPQPPPTSQPPPVTPAGPGPAASPAV